MNPMERPLAKGLTACRLIELLLAAHWLGAGCLQDGGTSWQGAEGRDTEGSLTAEGPGWAPMDKGSGEGGGLRLLTAGPCQPPNAERAAPGPASYRAWNALPSAVTQRCR